MDNDESPGESRLVDLSEITLEMISRLDGSVLAEALTRVLRESGSPTERYAAFQNKL
ncbi:FxSxx-COOH cyclophane-containing RiPP peptide [Amycolatopsis pigmentata]|uniref:FxSxx-COOH cyclophane-containing RiPP peptide n=1 Tax=Amycolatopsis pigmentata TaxID=450801 RepID=A0ABW5G5B0_9PSEU